MESNIDRVVFDLGLHNIGSVVCVVGFCFCGKSWQVCSFSHQANFSGAVGIGRIAGIYITVYINKNVKQEPSLWH